MKNAMIPWQLTPPKPEGFSTAAESRKLIKNIRKVISKPAVTEM